MTQTSGSVAGLTSACGFNGLHGTIASIRSDADLGFRTPDVDRAMLLAESGQEDPDEDPGG
ncbi:MAG TPA: hypothetical protein VNU25_02055 [Candidatus Paceibacterota bacterium]|nr:hypothetical protein [Candidatus Paceibacterota bacterium]